MLYSIPVIIFVGVWSSFQNEKEILELNNTFIYVVREITSWYFILWFIGLLYFMFALTFSPKMRNMLLIKLTRIKERDEREVLITGEISKKTFLATLWILIILLFVSILNIDIGKIPKDQVVNGKEHRISIGLHFKLIENRSETDSIFSVNGLPLSNQGLIFLLLLWQIGCYRYLSRYQFETE